MEVANFIREYLFKQDYLDVPELGTFFLSKDPFSLEGAQKIKPSSKILIFRENDRINSDLLVHFIARRKQISIEEAKILVSQFTLEIRNLIKRKGAADISGFGKFTSEDGFHLDFKAHPANYSPISFGLGELNLPPLEKKQENYPSSEKFGVFSNYKPFSGSLSSDSKPGPTLNEIYSNKSILENRAAGESAKESPAQDNNLSNNESIGIPDTNTHPEPSTHPNQEDKQDQKPDSENLPTAEEIYKTYGFQPDHTKLNEPQITQNPIIENPLPYNLGTHSTNTETSPFPEDVSNKFEGDTDSLVLDQGMNQSLDHTHQESTEPIDSPTEETKTHESPLLVDNPLPYSESNLGFNTNSEFTSTNPVYSNANTDNHEDINEPEYQAPAANYTWVWILTSLILVATLASLAYLERARIQKQFPGFFPVSSSVPSKDRSNLAQTQDSLQKTLTKTSSEDTLQKTVNSDSTLQKPTISDNKTTSNSTIDSSQKSNTSTKNSATGEALKEPALNKPKGTGEEVRLVKDADPYLIISASFHLKLTAKKQTAALNKRGFNSFVVEMSRKGLFPFQVCLGGYPDLESAEKALNTFLSGPEFKTGKKPYIFENKTKPSN